MKEIIRKMNLSIITCALVLVLNVTTTFAWAGLQTYSNVENFDVSLESSQTYQIKISLDGENFSSNLNELAFKRTVLDNMGVMLKGFEYENEEAVINERFEKIVLEPLTTKRIGNELGPFVSIDEIRNNEFDYDSYEESKEIKKSYFNFDIYLSLDCYSDAEEDYTRYQDIYIKNIRNLLIGNNKTYKLKSNHVLENYLKDQVLSTVKVNSSSAARISFTKYQAVKRGDLETNIPLETIIYQGGSATPTYENGIHSFGGFLNSTDNLAYMDFNDIHSLKPINNEVFKDFYENRKNESGLEDAISGDEVEGNHFKLITKEDGLNTKTMIKINVKMWLEGFDADCFEVVSSLPLGFDLTFLHYDLH